MYIYFQFKQIKRLVTKTIGQTLTTQDITTGWYLLLVIVFSISGNFNIQNNSSTAITKHLKLLLGKGFFKKLILI